MGESVRYLLSAAFLVIVTGTDCIRRAAVGEKELLHFRVWWAQEAVNVSFMMSVWFCFVFYKL